MVNRVIDIQFGMEEDVQTSTTATINGILVVQWFNRRKNWNALSLSGLKGYYQR